MHSDCEGGVLAEMVGAEEGGVKFYPIQGGSADWYGARLGRPTASNFDKIVTPKGKPSAQASTYLYKLACERLLHETMDDQIGYVKWVEHGKAHQDHAIKQFQFANEVALEPGGFITTDDGLAGASPDYLFPGHKAAVEVKCPAPWTQLRYLIEGPGEDHIAQLQGQLLVGEFDAVHFYSWHPQMPPCHHVVLPDPGYQGALKAALNAFCFQLERVIVQAREMGVYAFTRMVETPAEIAYQNEGDVQPKAVE